MPNQQLARGIWAQFSTQENPFGVPNGMEENLRHLDDHLALYTLLPPQAPGTPLPGNPVDGDGQAYTDGSYATFNGGTWRTYAPRNGVRVVLASGTESWLNTGVGWSQFSVVDTVPAVEAALAAAIGAAEAEITPLVQQAEAEAQSAASAVDAAFAEATAAQAARNVAEAARDAAMLSSGVYASSAEGLAATTSGRYFSVPSSSSYDHLILYRNNAGAAVEVKRYPSSTMLTTPPWTGKTNLWPDPFLRKLSAIGDVTAFLGKNRWYGNSTPKTLGFSLVDNPIYSGKALRRDPAYNSGVLNGPAMYFSEVGAVAGDTVTVRMAFVGTAAVTVYYRQRDAAGNYVVTQQLVGTTGTLNTTVPYIQTTTITVAANAVAVEFYFAHTNTTTYYDIVAIWGGKGAADTVPPTPAELPEVQSWNSVQARIAEVNNAIASAVAAGVLSAVLPISIKTDLNSFYSDTRLADIFTTSVASMVHGSYIGENGFQTVISGWDCPFIYSGTPFNVAKVYVCIEAPADVTFTISSSARVVLSSTTKKIYKSGWYFVPFDKTFSGADTTNSVYYLGFTAKNATRMNHPAGSWPATRPDLNVYGVYYTTTSSNGAWVLTASGAAGSVSHPSIFELHDFARADRSGLLTGDISGATIDNVTALDVKNTVYGAIIVSDVLAYDSKVVVQSGASIGVVRADPFAGWSAIYNREAGKSFNMVRIPQASRTINAADASQKWTRFVLEIRDSGPSGTLLATAEVAVDPEVDTLTNIDFLLRNPTTGAVVTMTDANLPAIYSIGFIAYNAAGGKAVAGESKGTMANYEGHSYYITRTASAWYTYVGNPSLVFETSLLTNPRVDKSYAVSQDALPPMVTDITRNTELIIANTVYAVSGIECPVYLDNLTLTRAQEFYWDVNCSVGQQQNERFVVTSGTAGSYPLTIEAIDPLTIKKAASKSVTLKLTASAAGSGLTKSVLVIGDSLVNAGTITQTLLDLATADVMKVSLLGTRGTGLNRHEGRGGWTVNDYSTIGRTYYKFTVSGVTTAPAINSTVYTNNGGTFTVQEVSLSGGAGYFVCSYTGSAPAASGVLTKTFGTGDATVSFSASEPVVQNPFWINGAVNFGQYLTNNGYSAPDWVLIALGINDVFGQTTDDGASAAADAAFAKLDTLIASIKDANANTRVGLMVPTPPAGQDGFGVSYANGQTAWRDRRNILIWGRQLIAKYSGQEASRVYVVPSNVALDTVNNYPRTGAAPVNARNSSITVQRQSNGVHPDTSGYQQIGDAVWSFLKYYA